jgi:HTH-type transcriptional regulator / antitoxin HigA
MSRRAPSKTACPGNVAHGGLDVARSTDNAQAGPDRGSYLELVLKFPLRPLRTDDELHRAIEMIDSLIIRGDLDSGEQDYLDILTDIVERYEADEHPMAPVTDAVMLRHLIDARGVTQSKLAADVKLQMSTISEVLNGKRRLNRHHIAVLSKYFRVSSAVFQP